MRRDDDLTDARQIERAQWSGNRSKRLDEQRVKAACGAECAWIAACGVLQRCGLGKGLVPGSDSVARWDIYEPVFDFGIVARPVFVPAGLVIPGYHAHWIVRFQNVAHGVFVPAVDYPPESEPVDTDPPCAYCGAPCDKQDPQGPSYACHTCPECGAEREPTTHAQRA